MSFLLKFLTDDELTKWANGNYFSQLKAQFWELQSSTTSEEVRLKRARLQEALEQEDIELNKLATNLLKRIMNCSTTPLSRKIMYTIRPLSEKLFEMRSGTSLAFDSPGTDSPTTSTTTIEYSKPLSTFLNYIIAPKIIEIIIADHLNTTSTTAANNGLIHLCYTIVALCENAAEIRKLAETYPEDCEFSTDIFAITKDCAKYGFGSLVQAIIEDNDWFPFRIECELTKVAIEYDRTELLTYLFSRFDYSPVIDPRRCASIYSPSSSRSDSARSSDCSEYHLIFEEIFGFSPFAKDDDPLKSTNVPRHNSLPSSKAHTSFSQHSFKGVSRPTLGYFTAQENKQASAFRPYRDRAFTM